MRHGFYFRNGVTINEASWLCFRLGLPRTAQNIKLSADLLILMR